MNMTQNNAINRLLVRVKTRAETEDSYTLQRTFVPLEPLLSMLQHDQHQVLYGRRGTGKTHVLKYLAETLRAKGNFTIYLDLRTIGSSGGLYGDRSESLPLRATNLLVDVVEALHTELLHTALEDERQADRLEALSGGLDRLAESAAAVRVVGPVEDEVTTGHSTQLQRDVGGSATLARLPNATLSGSSRRTVASTTENRRRRSGVEQPHVLFGPLASAVRQVAEACRPHQLWIMLDEWSAVPLELQPLLADLLRRAFFAAPNVVVKIGAIQRRSRFYAGGGNGDYIGIELGADTSASLDLDDFLLFENNKRNVAAFFGQVLYKHLYALMESRGFEFAIKVEDDFIKEAFRSRQAFDELIYASAGVPRDAIQIAGSAANAAGDKPIATQNVHAGARDYFLRRTTPALCHCYAVATRTTHLSRSSTISG